MTHDSPGPSTDSERSYFFLRSFAHTYHRALSAFKPLNESKGLAFTISFKRDEGVRTRLEPPYSPGVQRFMVAMRPFLNPADPLHVRNVWQVLCDSFGNDVPSDLRDEIGLLLDELMTGRVFLHVNNKPLTDAAIYELMAEGEYFGQSEEQRKKLIAIVANPIAGPMLWSRFYSYHVDAIVALSHVFGVYKRVRKGPIYEALMVALGSGPCIFCRKADGPYDEEHIFPEVLGNRELVLPKGFVCKTCNNEVLAILDKALVEFEPISLMRLWFGSGSKDGAPPKAVFQNATLRRNRPTNIRIDSHGKSVIRNEEKQADGTVHFRMELRGRKRLDFITIGRALFKIGLEIIALRDGRGAALDPRFDAARDFVLRGGTFENDLWVLTESSPRPGMEITQVPLAPMGLISFVSVYGVMFGFNLESEPKVCRADELRNVGFVLVSLRDGQRIDPDDAEKKPDSE